MAAGSWRAVKTGLATALVSLTINDRVASFVSINGHSMLPTIDPSLGELALVERLPLDRYDYSRGDVVIFRSPTNPRMTTIKRLIALPGDWIQVPEAREIRQIPEGHCWVEGDNAANSRDSRHHGPIPLGLMRGRVTHIVWPPHKIGQVDRMMPQGRVMQK